MTLRVMTTIFWPQPLQNANRRRGLKALVLAAGLFLLCSSTAWAATQGKPGRTSTATVNITLHIPAHKPITSAAQVKTLRDAATDGSGFVALRRYCQSGEATAGTPVLRHGAYFEAYVAGSEAATIRTMSQFCEPGTGIDGATLVVAPL